MKRKSRHSNFSLVLVCLLPFYVLFAAFYLVPIAYGIVMSLYNVGIELDVFIGVQNFIDLASDRLFWISFRNTLLYVVVMAVGGFGPILVAGILELHLSENDRFRRIYYSVTLAPWVVSWVSLGFAWRFLFSSYIPAGYEAIQNVVPLSGEFGNPLNSPDLALPMVALVWLWTWFGFNILLLKAGMKSVDPALIEAARVDGARNLRIFFGIIIPAMLPYVVFMATMGFIWTFQIFDPIWLLTGESGGPGGWTTSSLTYLMVKEAKSYFRFGYASAMGVVVSLFVLAVSLTQFRLMYKRLV